MSPQRQPDFFGKGDDHVDFCLGCKKLTPHEIVRTQPFTYLKVCRKCGYRIEAALAFGAR